MLEYLFPNLADQGYRIMSEASEEYNCIAWAAGDTARWWEALPGPGYYWPEGLSVNDTVDDLVRLFARLGYQSTQNNTVESGFEKIAIYGEAEAYTHAARQLSNGKWTSKIGSYEDIEHDTLEGLTGTEYGIVKVIMKRPKESARETRSKLNTLET